MRLVNLTPHEIVVLDRTGTYRATFPPSGRVARVTSYNAPGADLDVEAPGDLALDVIDGEITIATVGPTRYGEVVDLPAPEAGVGYVVSGLVAAALAGSGRDDVFAPDTSPASVVRNAAGQVVAVRRLVGAA